MKYFSWGNWHLHLKFYWFHLNHFIFFGWLLIFLWSIFHENNKWVLFLWGEEGRRGWWFSHRQQLEQQELLRFICALHHQMSHSTKKMPFKNQLHEKYDKCIDLSLRRFTYGALAGVAFGVLLLRRPTTRCASIAFGVGAGLGSAHAECSQILGIDMPQWFSIVPKWPRWNENENENGKII